MGGNAGKVISMYKGPGVGVGACLDQLRPLGWPTWQMLLWLLHVVRQTGCDETRKLVGQLSLSTVTR